MATAQSTKAEQPIVDPSAVEDFVYEFTKSVEEAKKGSKEMEAWRAKRKDYARRAAELGVEFAPLLEKAWKS